MLLYLSSILTIGAGQMFCCFSFFWIYLRFCQRRIQEFAVGEADPGFQFGGGTWRAR